MSILTADGARRMNNDNDLNKEFSIGSKLREIQMKAGMNDAGSAISPLLIFTHEVTADSTANPAILTLPFAVEVVDVIVHCTTSNASGSLTLGKGATAITGALACVTAGALARATTLAVAAYQLVAGDTLNVDANGASDRGKITVFMRKV